MRSMMLSPSAHAAAITSDIDARKSVAITGAGVNFSTPSTMAVWPSTRILAPMRCSSGTCIKRFSKIFSMMVLVPSARQQTAISCACISVGKPGCTWVRISTAFGRPFMTARIQSSPVVMTAPIASNFLSTGCKNSADVFLVSTSPSLINAPARYEPVSIRSAMTLYSQPCRLSTPSMIIVVVPIPLIFAPIATSILARSTTSGSVAQFSRRVVPRASAAAMITFSVPPTVTISKLKSQPIRRPPAGALALT